MRGGLDDALEKLARRDELRRRAEGGGTGTPPAVQDLVEAIAAVVGRNPALAVTVGVEGAGDPVLLHFTMQDGIVQVSADNTVASQVAEAEPTSPRHADFDVDVAEPVQDPYPYPAAPAPETGQATRRYDGPYRPATPGYTDEPTATHRCREPSDNGHGHGPAPQSSGAAGESPAADGAAAHRLAEQRIMPTPLPEPVPLRVDSGETELAAKRVVALLRDNPSLLRPSTSD